MPNKPGNDDRTLATGGIGDRGGQRDVASGAGSASGVGGGSGGSGAADIARQNGSQNPAAQARSRSNRGFASMDREKQREIASKGGRAAHAKGTAHEFDSGEAREAGRKGGMAVSRNRDHMAAIGRRGGEARGHSRARSTAQTNTAGIGSSSEGSFQNTRGGIQNSERQVAINNQSEGVNANLQGNRGGNSSLGGERRPQGTEPPSRNESFGH
jgi:general stress protein YciG